MARPAGVEPATFGSVDQRSIQLSYGRERLTPSRTPILQRAYSSGKSAFPTAYKPDGQRSCNVVTVSPMEFLAAPAAVVEPTMQRPKFSKNDVLSGIFL